MNAMTTNPTIKDIARIAGVHFTTVSLALRNNPRIPQNTQERIQAIAKEIGYSKNEISTSLVRSRSNRKQDGLPPQIAFVTNREDDSHIFERAHMRAMLDGARAASINLGYTLKLVRFGSNPIERANAETTLLNASIKGILFAALIPPFAPLNIDLNTRASVKVDSRFVYPNMDLVANNQMQEVIETYDHLFDRGYRRIGMAVSDIDDLTSNGLFSGAYAFAQQARGIQSFIRPLYLKRGRSNEETASAIGDWIRREKLDAVVTNWNNGLSLVQIAGYSPPYDLGFACLSLGQNQSDTAGMFINHHEAGKQAVERLASAIRKGIFGLPEAPTTLLISSSWNNGTTVSKNEYQDLLAG